jgi:alkylation response protein AidB-like acyl-CoA dehydrogenase
MTASDYTELHDELRGMARELLATGDAAAIARAGWSDLEIPETLGGAGVTFAETAVVIEELGRVVARTKLLGTTLGVATLLALPPDAACDSWLTTVVTGEPGPVAVLATGDHPAIGFRLNGSRLCGHAEFVADAASAPLLLIPAADSAGVPVIAAVTPDTDGVTVSAQPVLDETRDLATVHADNAVVGQVWAFADDPHAAVGRLVDRAAATVAIDSLGLAETMLAATVDHVRMRRQFGRPIGSFQAVKHACADMAVRIQVSRQLVNGAIAAVTGGRDADAPASRAVSMAKAHACDTAVAVVGKAMQLHGGIGYTWESGIHVYLKRATLNRALFGSPAAHRKAVAVRYE